MTQPSEESVPPYTPEEQQHIGHIPDLSELTMGTLHGTKDPAILAAMVILGERVLRDPEIEMTTWHHRDFLE